MDNKKMSFVMGERLKKLREEKGLSHERLGRELFEKYKNCNDSKIDDKRRKRGKDETSQMLISKDSLINYEISEETHSKAYKNEGMSAEYLRYLADFYDVSSDFILGLTDVSSCDVSVQSVCKRTGLSQESVKKIDKWRRSGFGDFAMDLISKMIEDNEFIPGVLRAGYELADIKNNRVKIRSESEDEIEIDDGMYTMADKDTVMNFYAYIIQKGITDFVYSYFQIKGEDKNAKK